MTTKHEDEEVTMLRKISCLEMELRTTGEALRTANSELRTAKSEKQDPQEVIMLQKKVAELEKELHTANSEKQDSEEMILLRQKVAELEDNQKVDAKNHRQEVKKLQEAAKRYRNERDAAVAEKEGQSSALKQTKAQMLADKDILDKALQASHTDGQNLRGQLADQAKEITQLRKSARTEKQGRKEEIAALHGAKELLESQVSAMNDELEEISKTVVNLRTDNRRLKKLDTDNTEYLQAVATILGPHKIVVQHVATHPGFHFVKYAQADPRRYDLYLYMARTKPFYQLHRDCMKNTLANMDRSSGIYLNISGKDSRLIKANTPPPPVKRLPRSTPRRRHSISAGERTTLSPEFYRPNEPHQRQGGIYPEHILKPISETGSFGYTTDHVMGAINRLSKHRPNSTA
jgi:hypothetical protein